MFGTKVGEAMMDALDWIVVGAAGVWGVLVAAAYHWTRIGRFLTARMPFLILAVSMASWLLFQLMMANNAGQIHVRDAAAVGAVLLIGPAVEGVASLYDYFVRWMDAEEDRCAVPKPVGITRRSSGDD